MKKRKIISEEFYSNCLVEALKAKFKNPAIKIYFRPPYIKNNGRISSMHFMWEDANFSYDFVDSEYSGFWKYFWHSGYICQWPKDFARRFTSYRPR